QENAVGAIAICYPCHCHIATGQCRDGGLIIFELGCTQERGRGRELDRGTCVQECPRFGGHLERGEFKGPLDGLNGDPWISSWLDCEVNPDRVEADFRAGTGAHLRVVWVRIRRHVIPSGCCLPRSRPGNGITLGKVASYGAGQRATAHPCNAIPTFDS